MSAQPGTDLSGQPKPTFAINKTGLSHPSRLHHNAVLVRPEAAMYLTQIIPANELDDYAKLRSGIYQAIVD